MGEKGDEVQLLGFLNAVLGKTGDDKFSSIEILENKSFIPDNIGNKSVTFDVRAVLQGKTRVNVEVQLRNEYNMDKRSLFHWSREFSTSLKAGQDFRELPDVIAINIVNFNYLDTSDYHSCFRLRDDKERDVVLTGALEIHFINMVRYRKLKDLDILNDPLSRWLVWLNRNSRPELIAEVVKMDTAIQAANEQLTYITGDEESRRAYELRFTALCDETTNRNFYTEKGRAEGLGQGLEQGRGEGKREKAMEIAQNLKAAGISDEIILQTTGLNTKK